MTKRDEVNTEALDALMSHLVHGKNEEAAARAKGLAVLISETSTYYRPLGVDDPIVEAIQVAASQIEDEMRAISEYFNESARLGRHAVGCPHDGDGAWSCGSATEAAA